MRLTPIIVTVIAIVAIVLFWFPYPLVVTLGQYTIRVGGYLNVPSSSPNPNYNPQAARARLMTIGIVLTAAFIAVAAVAWYISIQVEKLESMEGEYGEEYEEEEYGGYAPSPVGEDIYEF